MLILFMPTGPVFDKALEYLHGLVCLTRKMDEEKAMLAIPVFRARVAPVLDWCSKIIIFPEEGAECRIRSTNRCHEGKYI